MQGIRVFVVYIKVRRHRNPNICRQENPMSLRILARWTVHAICLASLSAMAQPSPNDLKDDQIRTLVSGKRLELRFAGTPPSDPKFFSHWNFRADGSLCARLIGSGPKTECADVGKWQAENNSLCWKLNSIGTTTGINSTCGWVRKGEGDLYEIVDTTGKLGSTLFSTGR